MIYDDDLTRPRDAAAFEAMCRQLYAAEYTALDASRVGRSGQGQFGVDILCFCPPQNQRFGIQCKDFSLTKLTAKRVIAEIGKADKAGLKIDHLLIATTAPNDAKVVKEIQEISDGRRRAGLFSVSIDHWNDICGRLQVHPRIAAAFIPNHPSGAIMTVVATTTDTLAEMRQQSVALVQLDSKLDILLASRLAGSAPMASGAEADLKVVARLDLARDQLREGRSSDARRLLEELGNPHELRDRRSRFRWYTNMAAVLQLEGEAEQSAQHYLLAFDVEPEEEKAHINRVNAFFMLKDAARAAQALVEALSRFPLSPALWGLQLHAMFEEGQRDPEAALPVELREHEDVIFSRARLRSRLNDFEGAVDLWHEAVRRSPESLEVLNGYLADALTWAASNQVAVAHGHLSQKQREVLMDAVSRFEPYEEKVVGLQSRRLSLEISNNLSVALRLLGNVERARGLARQALHRHPLSEGLLRVFLDELNQKNDLQAIHELVDGKLDTLPVSVIAVTTEIAAIHGKEAWHQQLDEAVRARSTTTEVLSQLDGLRVQVMWAAGRTGAALALTRQLLSQHPDDIFTRSLLVGLLDETGDADAAKAEAMPLKRRWKDTAQR